MNLALAFWAPRGVAEDEARADVLRQTEEWAAAEPNVTSIAVKDVSRPYPHRKTWYQVNVILTMKQEDR